jgi:hypothetical protein
MKTKSGDCINLYSVAKANLTKFGIPNSAICIDVTDLYNPHKDYPDLTGMHP